MKRNLIGIVLLAVMLCACNSGSKGGAYHIRGVVTNPKLDGRTIYLRDAVDGTVKYDSVKVCEGRFVFNGNTAVPQVQELFIQENDSDFFPVTLPVVLEAGEIKAQIGDIVLVEGTSLNEDMMQLLLDIDQFKNRDFVGKGMDEIKQEFNKFLLEEIVKHATTPIGCYLYGAYQNKFNDEQKASAQKTLGSNLPQKND